MLRGCLHLYRLHKLLQACPHANYGDEQTPFCTFAVCQNMQLKRQEQHILTPAPPVKV